MNAWIELLPDEYNAVWDRFYEKFEFRPDYYERTVPAIREPSPSKTFSISHELPDLAIASLDDIFCNAFRAILPTDGRMYVLDWQHTSYFYYPNRGNGNWPLDIIPNGDYYIFIAEDFSFGTFGHPWQMSLCVFGRPLLDALGGHVSELFNVIRMQNG